MKKAYQVLGMKCQGCSDTVTKKLSTVIGVKEVAVDLQQGHVLVTGRPIRFLMANALKGTKFQLGQELDLGALETHDV